MSVSVGAAHYSQADPDGDTDREGPLWRGVDGEMEGRESSCESLFHHRGGQLVQRDRDISDCPHETREYTG